MSTIVGKRKYEQIRSSFAEPDLNVSKRLLVTKMPETEYQYKTMCSEFFPKEKIKLDPIDIALKNNVKYHFKNRLRRPLIIPISENSFIYELTQLPQFKGKNDGEDGEKKVNLAKFLKGTKKKSKFLKVKEALEEGNKDYAELGRCFKISRQEIRAMDLRLKKDGKIKASRIKKPKKLKQEHLEFLKELMLDPENCFLRLYEMKDLLIAKFNLPNNFCSTYTIHKTLRFLKISEKKVVKFVENRNKERPKPKED